MTALHMMHDALLKAKDKPLVERRGQWFSGSDLLNRIYARAQDLQTVELKSGDAVLIIVTDNLVAIEQLFACWLLGASACFVDFRTPPARISELAQRLPTKVIIGIKPIPELPVHLQLVDIPLIAVRFDELPELPNNVAIHFSSSGTTGAPRISPSIQSQLAINIKASNSKADWAVNGAALSSLSVAYTASCYFWLLKLAIGQPIVALDLVHRISELDKNLKRADVSEAGLAPSQIRKLLEITGVNDPRSIPRYPQLTNFCSVGGPANQHEKYAAVTQLSAHYRMTYSAVGIGRISRLCGDEVKQRPASVGRPSDDVTVTIYDGDRVCDVGEIGEISVSNELFEDKRPGDLGYFDADGYLYITGRVQGLLCRNGVNFNSERIIEVALQHPAISNAEVISRPDGDDGDAVYLVVECDEDKVAELWVHIRKHLPIAEHPDQIIVLRNIATTPSLKNDSPAIRAAVKDLIGTN